MKRLFVLISALGGLFLAGCGNSHLEIFPPLDDPGLVSIPIPAQQLHEDIDAFHQGVLLRHPDVENYADLAALEVEMEVLKSQIQAPMTRAEFYRYVGSLTHLYNDGHTMLLWPYQELNAFMEAGGVPFPFDVLVDHDQRIFMRSSYRSATGGQLSRGEEILTINGIASAQWVEKLQRFASGDNAYLRTQFVAARLGTYLWSVGGIADDLEIETEMQGQVRKLAISPQDDWQVNNADGASEGDDSTDFEYRRLSDDIAVLRVATFDVDNAWFESFVDESMAQANQDGVAALVVDVRENTGGNTDAAVYLSRYLADRDFRLVSKMKEKLNPDNRGFLGYKGSEGEIIESDWDEWEAPVERNKRFHGRVYVLISPITYSAGIVFASTMKDAGFATLVGQETGGNANQTAQGNLFNLPHSQLRAYVATRSLIRPSGSEKRGGVKPDILVERSGQALLNEADPELQAAMTHWEQQTAE